MAPRKKGLPEITEEEMPKMPEVVQEEALETTTVAESAGRSNGSSRNGKSKD